MRWEDLGQERCSMARALAVVGERWTLMILRDCFLGLRRFDAFQARLGVSRTIVADRLETLVREGVLERRAYQERPLRHEYRLTTKGMDLHPAIMALVHWGDRHYSAEAGVPLLHRHRACGCDFHPVQTCSACGETVEARSVEVRAGPGA